MQSDGLKNLQRLPLSTGFINHNLRKGWELPLEDGSNQLVIEDSSITPVSDSGNK